MSDWLYSDTVKEHLIKLFFPSKRKLQKFPVLLFL